MKKFRDVKQKNNKYTKQLDKALMQVMPTVVQAFINVYGEKHAEYIRKTIMNLKLCYFIPNSHLELFREYHAYLSEEDNDLINYYLAYIQYLFYKYEKIEGSDEEKLDFIYQNFLVKSDLSIDQLKRYDMVEPIEEDCPLFTFRIDHTDINPKIISIIMLPIIFVTLEMIIHEINHALTCDPVGYIDNDIIFETTLFCVNDMASDTDNTPEEIVNDYISNLVLTEFCRLGGFIPRTLEKYDIGNDYIENNYIAKYLFKMLGPLILESLISHNSRLFINSVGRENYIRLCELMSDLFNNGKDDDKYLELMILIDEMVKEKTRIKSEDVDGYYKELESLGLKVRKL